MRALGITFAIVWVVFMTSATIHLLLQLQYRTASVQQVQQINKNSTDIAVLQGKVDTINEFGTDKLQERLEEMEGD